MVDTLTPPTTAPVPPAPERAKRRRGLAAWKPSVITGGWPTLPLYALMGVTFLGAFDLAIQGVVAPEIRDFFGLDLSQLGLFITISSLLGLALALPVGFVADRVNRAKMTAIGLLLLGIFSLATGAAPTILLFGIARFGRGLGQSFEIAESSLLADFYPPETRPALFAARGTVYELARTLCPLIVGLIAAVFFWQAAYVIVAPFALVLAFYFWFRVREPVRGEMERRAMGATEDVALTAEEAPSFGEAMRMIWGVRTLRRTYWALPFLVGSVTSLGTLISIYYQQRFNLGPGVRGLLLSVTQPAAMAGLVFGGAVANRVMRYRPGRVITYGGIAGFLSGLGFLAAALMPTVWLVVPFFMLSTFFSAILNPGTTAVITLITPPRARSAGISMSLIFIVPGIVFQYFALIFGQQIGIQAAIIFMVPVFWIGAAILASAGGQVEADMRAALAASMASFVARQSKEEGEAKLLVVRDLDVHYGQVQILFNVDFDVTEGEVIALLGTNGAGKSTLLRAISGLTPPSNGAVFYDGQDITHLPPSEHAAKGIIQVPGGRGIFPGLSVAENLQLACWMFRDDSASVKAATEEVLSYFPVLRERLDEVAGNLSGGQQQMLTLGQAFLSRPRLLMIDELSLGLAPTIVAQLLEIVRAIADRGTTIILVEQSVNVALTVAEKAVFMEKGEIRFSGPTAELMQRTDILRSVYLKGSAAAGGSIGSSARRAAAGADPSSRETVLELRGVHKSFGGVHAIDGVSFPVYDGQILGLIGPNGAGKTTIFDIISGFIEPDDGEVRLLGEDVTLLGPDERARAGLQRSFQDARLFPALTVSENIAVALERYVEVRSTTLAAMHLPNVRNSERKIARRTDRLIQLLSLGDFRDKFVRELSTGSRRIVDLACCMAADPKVLLLDEPSSGIAQKEAEELGPLLQRIKYETGCTLLLIEHDMNLIRSISDELLALDLGSVVTRGSPTEVVEDPRVIESYLGTSEAVINRSGNA